MCVRVHVYVLSREIKSIPYCELQLRNMDLEPS